MIQYAGWIRGPAAAQLIASLAQKWGLSADVEIIMHTGWFGLKRVDRVTWAVKGPGAAVSHFLRAVWKLEKEGYQSSVGPYDNIGL